MTLSSVGIHGHPWPVTEPSERGARTVHAVARPLTSGRVRRMFAHSTQNWWWPAHPAAH
ncbi:MULTISPECIES: trp operon leader peptide [Streptomyces]|uniref:trp operon leader peptide n=1 Tax=Streptomyces TaxID=1883 RepID=UPI000D1BFE8A